MADFARSAEDRDRYAADRDQAARLRDVQSEERDAVADRRDDAADARDRFSSELGSDFDVRLGHLRRDLVDRFARNSDSAIEPDDYPELGAAALARLRVHAEDQRRLAEADRVAASSIFAEIHNQLRHLRSDGLAATVERHAAIEDRHTAASDRRAAARDRDASLRDRSQAAIERGQRTGPDQPPAPDPGSILDRRMERTEATVARTRQRVRDSRELLAREPPSPGT